RTPARRPRRRRLGLPPRTRHHVVAPPSPRVPPIRWVRPPTLGESTREERRAGQAAPRHEQARLLERRPGKRPKSGPRGRKGGTMTRRSVVWVALLFSVSLPGVAGARSTTRLCHVSPGAQPQSIEVAPADVPTHLAHGDAVGNCTDPAVCSAVCDDHNKCTVN